MRNFSSLLLCITLLLSYSSLFSQNQGGLFLQNYPPKVYGGHAQNWVIVQDHRGVMYVGNGNGIMEYDGNEWRMITLPNETTARSIAVSDDKTVGSIVNLVKRYNKTKISGILSIQFF
jgi:hypothetical protein